MNAIIVFEVLPFCKLSSFIKLIYGIKALLDFKKILIDSLMIKLTQLQ